MGRFLPYVWKCLWRSRTRTLLTAGGTAVALFVFTILGAVRQGLADLTRDRSAERTLIVFQANRFCPATSRLPEDYERRIAKLDGVRDVVPIKVFMNNCRASLDLVVFHGMPADKVRSARGIELTSGDWSAFESRPDAAVVGRALARRRGLEVGKKFSIGEATVTVAGIFRAEQPADEHFLYTHLSFLQRLRGLNSVGEVTQFEVTLTEEADPREVGRAIDAAFRSGPAATDTRPRGVFQARAVGDLAELIGLSQYLGMACIGLVLALTATTIVMAVQDRVREHALLQTLGFTSGRIFGLVLIESVLVGLVGGAVGVGSAMGTLLLYDPAIGTEGVSIALRPSFGPAATGLIVTVLVGMLAGLVPAWRASRADIVASLRAV